MKRILSILSVAIACGSISAHGHPGKLDKNGGHTEAATGKYHLHHKPDAKKPATKKAEPKKPEAKKEEPKKKK